MIEIKKVTKSFEKTKALKDIDLTIFDHEIFGIVGYSGAGKSTLVRIINQLEKQDAGSVLIDDVNISSLKEKELKKVRQKIGMVFQNFNLLWSRTVKENIALPLEIAKWNKSDIDKKVDMMLQLVGLEDKKNAYPSELSGGQKQRVGIARAIALSPKILLCDEATSALDPKTADDILKLLKKINKETGITIVMITHQMEVVQKICHRIAVMADGKIIEVGRTSDIFRSPQNELTKKLIRGADKNNSEVDTQELIERYKGSTLLRLTFDSMSSKEPILSNLASNKNFVFNIVEASIKSMQDGEMGVMYITTNSNVDEMIKELEKKGVQTERVC